MSKIEAIKRVLGEWGLSEYSRLDAIKAIVCVRATPDKVVAKCEAIRDAVAELYNLASNCPDSTAE